MKTRSQQYHLDWLKNDIVDGDKYLNVLKNNYENTFQDVTGYLPDIDFASDKLYFRDKIKAASRSPRKEKCVICNKKAVMELTVNDDTFDLDRICGKKMKILYSMYQLIDDVHKELANTIDNTKDVLQEMMEELKELD